MKFAGGMTLTYSLGDDRPHFKDERNVLSGYGTGVCSMPKILMLCSDMYERLQKRMAFGKSDRPRSRRIRRLDLIN